MTFITVSGNLTATPVLRFTASGKPVVNFTVVENLRRRGEDGHWVDAGRSFYRCTAWGGFAEHIMDSFTKGMRVIVTGKLTLREYVKADGGFGLAAEISVEDMGASTRFSRVTVHEAKEELKTAVPEMAPF